MVRPTHITMYYAGLRATTHTHTGIQATVHQDIEYSTQPTEKMKGDYTLLSIEQEYLTYNWF
jgi:hypothetical protein